MIPSPLQATTVPFGERLVLAAVGPVIVVIVGGLVVWFITHTIQSKREDAIRNEDQRAAAMERERDRARADSDKERELRARDDALRHELVSKMTDSASSLYLMTQHFWRAKLMAKENPGNPALEQAVEKLHPKLDEQYLRSRAAGEAIEHQLGGYFDSELPQKEWHKVQDLLTVRYFQVIERATGGLYAKNEGDGHTGLSLDQLKDPKTLLNSYHQGLKDAVDLVFSETLRSRSSAP